MKTFLALMAGLLFLGCTKGEVNTPPKVTFGGQVKKGLDGLLVCPLGFVKILRLRGYVESAFCVAKYEMKKDGDGNAVSLPEGVPWVGVSRDEATRACRNMGENFDLVTNDQWQALARDIELVPHNWSGRIVGVGELNRGHSDDDPARSLAGGFSGCFGTGQVCEGRAWNSQKRTHTLSTGEIIWDVAGNAAEWVKDNHLSSQEYGEDAHISQITPSSHQGLGRLSGGTTTVPRRAKDQFGSIGDYTVLQLHHGGLGYAWLNYEGTGVGVVRGGAWVHEFGSGIFTVRIGVGIRESGPMIGFRCAFQEI